MAHNPEECKDIFVPWRAGLVGLASITGALIMGSIAGVLTFANVNAAQDRGIAENRKDIQDAARRYDMIERRLIADLDTLKRELRER